MIARLRRRRRPVEYIEAPTALILEGETKRPITLYPGDTVQISCGDYPGIATHRIKAVRGDARARCPHCSTTPRDMAAHLRDSGSTGPADACPVLALKRNGGRR